MQFSMEQKMDFIHQLIALWSVIEKERSKQIGKAHKALIAGDANNKDRFLRQASKLKAYCKRIQIEIEELENAYREEWLQGVNDQADALDKAVEKIEAVHAKLQNDIETTKDFIALVEKILKVLAIIAPLVL